MPSSKVSDETAKNESHHSSVRRTFIDNGTPFPAYHRDYRRISLRQGSRGGSFVTTKASIGIVNEMFIEIVKSSSKNLQLAIGEFCDEVLPDDNQLAREILMDLAPKIKPGECDDRSWERILRPPLPNPDRPPQPPSLLRIMLLTYCPSNYFRDLRCSS